MRKSIIEAIMLGHAIGDALGVPVEFSRREELIKNPVTDMRGFGVHKVPMGTWSDDTSMSIATLESLAKGKIDFDEIMQNFVDWLYDNKFTATNDTFDVGMTCQMAICNYRNHIYNSPIECGLKHENTNGNGSLMRIHPFALYMYFTMKDREDRMEIIHNASALTHAHSRSKMGCGIYTFVLWELLKKPSKKSVIKGLKTAQAYYKEWNDMRAYEKLFNKIGSLKTDVSGDEIKGSGYIVDSLEASIWCLLTTNSYEECVLKAVNLGSDTDTTGAIAGGLAGALYGYDNIPKKWLEVLGKKEYLEKMCQQAYEAWQKR